MKSHLISFLLVAASCSCIFIVITSISIYRTKAVIKTINESGRCGKQHIVQGQLRSKSIREKWAIQMNSIEHKPCFSDVILDKHFVLDMMELCFDIFEVTNDVTPQEVISNTKFKFEQYYKAEFSTVAMLVTFQRGNETIPVVIFRGSVSFDDWMVDMDTRMEESKFTNAPSGVMVHRGFQDALFNQNIVQDIEAKIIDMIGRNADIMVTGHSLG